MAEPDIRKMPKCDGRLKEAKDRAIIYECTDPQCGFVISRQRYAEILSDENHIMRRFLTPHERQILNNAIEEILP